MSREVLEMNIRRITCGCIDSSMVEKLVTVRLVNCSNPSCAIVAEFDVTHHAKPLSPNLYCGLDLRVF